MPARIPRSPAPLSRKLVRNLSAANPAPLLLFPSRRPLSQTAAMSLSESEIKRNPHGNFKAVEASRPAWDRAAGPRYTQTPSPSWTLGAGANDLAASDHDQSPPAHVAIDPYEDGRPRALNYKLLISAIVPRPIAFVSTRSADGSTTNLAPFSYFQMIGSDPPLFVIGFACPLDRSGTAEGPSRSKDTLRNLLDTGECVVNIISEHFVEAANAGSADAPFGASEWALGGLTPAYDCRDVRCARVKEAVFSVEAKLESVREFESRAVPGRKTSTMAIVEGTRFWVREDAINEERSIVDPAVLRPISRLGGITYARLMDMFELPRPNFEKDVGGQEGYEKLEKERGGIDHPRATNGKA